MKVLATTAEFPLRPAPTGYVCATDAARILGISLSAVSRRVHRNSRHYIPNALVYSVGAGRVYVPCEALAVRWRPSNRRIGRFWARVSVVLDAISCWEWQGPRFPTGYGQCNYDRLQYAHRVAWRLVYGIRPSDGLCVCHACDNPPCVRPSHLWLGTQRDNVADRDRKGRGAYGPNRPSLRIQEQAA